jgi:hypothetical protein
MNTGRLGQKLSINIFALCVFVIYFACGCGTQRTDEEEFAEEMPDYTPLVIDTKQEDCKSGMVIITHIGPTTKGVRALVLHTAEAPWTPEDLEWLTQDTLICLRGAPQWFMAKKMQRDFEVSEEQFRLILSATKPYLSNSAGPGIPVLSFGVMREIGGATMAFEFYVMLKEFDEFYTALVDSCDAHHAIVREAAISQAGQSKGLGFWSPKRRK